MDGGNMADQWRGVDGDDGDDLLQFPVPAECQNIDFWPPRRSFAMWRRSGGFLATSTSWSRFLDRTPQVVQRRASEASRGGHTLGPRRPSVWDPRAPTCLALLAPPIFWENRTFCINSEDFPESWISAQKRDTRTVLLKTALVRVSCIQNTQIRGKTIAKVFGKVDTFWTYQLPPSLAYCLSSSNSVNN
jgi:hypothetical protein